MNIMFSGGASGADTLFGKCAEKAGHQVIHYSFAGHRIKARQPHVILTEDELREANPYLRKVGKVIGRSFPFRSRYSNNPEYVNNLLRRNYWQIRETKRVYAVSSFDEDGIVKDGTAWAVYMAILKEVPDIYLFDQEVGQVWYRWFYDHAEWLSISYPYKPEGKYTAIGTRKLNALGEAAIIDLYPNAKESNVDSNI